MKSRHVRLAWAFVFVAACGRDPLDLPADVSPTRDAGITGSAGGSGGGRGGSGGSARLDAAVTERRDARAADAPGNTGPQLIIRPGAATVPVGFQVRPAALRVDGADAADVTKATKWAVLSDTTTGTWDGTAFTAKRAGVTQLGATFEGLTATATITTIAAVPLDVLVNPGQASVALGSRQTFSASIRYNEGSQSDATDLASWAVRDPAIATISNEPGQRGTALGKAAGSTLVTATVLGGIVGQAQLTVEAMAAPTTLVIAPSSPQRAVGGDVAFTAQATRNGKVENVTEAVKWDSSNKAIASFTGSRATCLAVGSTTITAMYMGATVSTRLSCAQNTGKVAAVVVKPSELTVVSGTAYKLTAEASYLDRTSRDVTASAEWTSSAPDVVSVVGGQLKVYKAGTATITATFDGQSGSAVANALR